MKPTTTPAEAYKLLQSQFEYEGFRAILPVLSAMTKADETHPGDLSSDGSVIPLRIELTVTDWILLQKFAERDRCTLDMAVSLMAQYGIHAWQKGETNFDAQPARPSS